MLGEGTVVELTGLTGQAGLDRLARELGRPLQGSELTAGVELCQAAGGRPLLLLRAAGLARLDPSGRTVLPRPGAITDLVPLLLDQLDESAIGVLHLLATLDGTELAAAHIGPLTGAPDPVALCDRLADLGLVESAEHGYRCAPDAVPALRRRRPSPFPAEAPCGYFLGWATQSTTATGPLPA